MLVNFLLFQLAWFSCVLGAAHALPWVGPLVVTLVVAWHLWRVPEPRAEGALLLVVALLGATFDSLLVAMGWLAYPSGQLHASIAPYWIVAMWVGFATTLNVSLGWLKGRAMLAFAFGAIGGPLAYLAGEKLGGVVLVERSTVLLVLAAGWAMMMPLLMVLATRFNGWRPGVGHRPLAAVTE